MVSGNQKSERVYQWIQAYIDENKFSVNKRIPSENALSMRFNYSRETIRYALNRLEEEGLIYRVKGSGTYINKEAAFSRELEPGVACFKIGLILQGQDTHANSALVEGVKSVLPLDQVDLRIFITDNKFATERRCLESVIYQSFSGFIIDGVKASLLNPNLDCYKKIYQKKIPVIFYNNYYQELRYPRVTINDFKCAEQLVNILAQAGHKKIASIFVYDNYQSIEKFQGVIAAMRKHGMEFKDDYVKWCVSNEAHDQKFSRNISKFLKNLPKCTAILCCNYMIMQLVWQVLKDAGKSIPTDYSVACFDYSGDDWEETGITCSVHQGYQIGSQVGIRLLRMINSGKFNDSSFSCIMEPKIYTGRTIKDIRSSIWCGFHRHEPMS